jgi:hypothetical protein
VDDQLSLLLKREGLTQDDRCSRFWGPLEELRDLSTSEIVLHVVTITTDKARIVRFTFILIINRLCLGLIGLWVVIFILLIPTLPFFGFNLTDRRRLNDVHFLSFTSWRGPHQINLNIRIPITPLVMRSCWGY